MTQIVYFITLPLTRGDAVGRNSLWITYWNYHGVICLYYLDLQCFPAITPLMASTVRIAHAL